MAEQSIEYFINENLTGPVQSNIIELVTYLRANEMLPMRQAVGYWADKLYWVVNYKDRSVCYIAINEYEKNTCVIWSDDSGSKWFENFPLDEHTKNIALKNVNVCYSPCGGCKQGKGTPMTVFGNEFDSVCLTSFKFTNPDADTVACMKKLIEIRKNDILKNTTGMFENMIIRLEEPKDYRTVEELTRAAFNNPDRVERSEIAYPMEHHMVNRLREKDGIMELNFVAELDGKIVGHIIYSHAHILQTDGSKIDVLNFGPISVLPEIQKMGIGSALMKHSIEEAKRLGYGAILFFGHPDYYPRFGFVDAREFDITDCNGENYPAFMAMELTEGYLKNAVGKFIEADIYNDDLNREQAKEFDKKFCAV